MKVSQVDIFLWKKDNVLYSCLCIYVYTYSEWSCECPFFHSRNAHSTCHIICSYYFQIFSYVLEIPNIFKDSYPMLSQLSSLLSSIHKPYLLIVKAKLNNKSVKVTILLNLVIVINQQILDSLNKSIAIKFNWSVKFSNFP